MTWDYTDLARITSCDFESQLQMYACQSCQHLPGSRKTLLLQASGALRDEAGMSAWSLSTCVSGMSCSAHAKTYGQSKATYAAGVYQQLQCMLKE